MEQLGVIEKHFYGVLNIIECSWVKLQKITQMNESSTGRNFELFLILKSKTITKNQIYVRDLLADFQVQFSKSLTYEEGEKSIEKSNCIQKINNIQKGSNVFFINQFHKKQIEGIVLNVFEKPYELMALLIESCFKSELDTVRTVEEWGFGAANSLEYCLRSASPITYTGYDISKLMFQEAVKLGKAVLIDLQSEIPLDIERFQAEIGKVLETTVTCAQCNKQLDEQEECEKCTIKHHKECAHTE